MLDQATIDAYEAPVEAATREAESYAQSVSDPTLRGTMVKATGMLRKAVDSWKTDQLAEVLGSGGVEGSIGTHELRPESWWTDYGKNLLDQAARYVRDNSDVYAQWSRAINIAGDASQAVVDYVDGQIQSWRATVDGYKQILQDFYIQEQTTESLAAVLAPVQADLPDDVRQLLWGTDPDAESAQAASNQLAFLTEAVQKADALVSALESGARAVFVIGDSGNNEDVTLSDSQDQSVPNLSGPPRLGTPLLVAGAVVAGLLALLAICGSLVAWLMAYYQHLAQVTTSQTVQNLYALQSGAMSILNDPHSTPEAKAAAQQQIASLNQTANTLANQKPPDPFGGLSDTLAKFENLVSSGAKALVTTAVVGIVGYVIYENREAIADGFKRLLAYLSGNKRQPNPRRRRKLRRLKGARA